MVTGASGFVGGELCRCLSHTGSEVIAITRNPGTSRPDQLGSSNGSLQPFAIGNINSSTDWSQPLQGVDAVVHLAGRAHVMLETAPDPLSEFRNSNVNATLNLARQAASRGVRRFVYISSVKVNGEATPGDRLFRESDKPMPIGPYAVSKYEAELSLQQLATEMDMEITIIRPPLVYGPGVKANFLSMMRWLYKGMPLPLGAINNKRSLVALDNLIDLIAICIKHPAAANQVFLVADGEDLSTTELLTRMAKALDKPVRLLPVPVWLLQAGATVTGKSAIAQRLCESLRVDIGKSRNLLGWFPPVSVNEAIHKSAATFLESQRK